MPKMRCTRWYSLMMADATQNRQCQFPIQNKWDRSDPVPIQMQEFSFKNQCKNFWLWNRCVLHLFVSVFNMNVRWMSIRSDYYRTTTRRQELQSLFTHGLKITWNNSWFWMVYVTFSLVLFHLSTQILCSERTQFGAGRIDWFFVWIGKQIGNTCDFPRFKSDSPQNRPIFRSWIGHH